MRDTAPALARFGRALRGESVDVSLRDELDAAQALRFVDLEDREEARIALRIALKIPRASFDLFDRLFSMCWDGGTEPPRPEPRPPARATPALPRGRLTRWDPDRRALTDAPHGAAPDGEDPGWSPEALLRRKAFDQGQWSSHELSRMERLLARLARRFRAKRSRRLIPTRGRGQPDLRSSYRRALRTSGELLTLARRTRALRKPKLVFLVDTSGSMDAHSRFLLTFVLCLRRAVPGAEAFAFNTELVHLTHALTPGKLRLSLDRLAAAVPDWSGGTRIGESLRAFVLDHLERRVDGKTVVVILSDGLDRGEPNVLEDALRRIQARARKLIWLNPLLGDARYQPSARGMRAALPFVDHFASAHDLQSLERLIPHLSS